MRSVILTLLIAGVFASNDEVWREWKRKYKKELNGVDDAFRRKIWEDNVKYIQEHNLRHDLGLVTYTLGLNQFTDMTFEEFKAKYLSQMSRVSNIISNGIPYKSDSLSVPESIDWRDSHHVTDVKNQGNCGSCWAFSTTGAMEGQYMKNFKTLLSFSEQQLVDCSRSFGNNGCGGGLMENAYIYLKQFGLETESEYPYTAQEGQCKYNKSLGKVEVTGFYTVHTGKEDTLKRMIAEQGPAAVALDVERDFMMYKKGVYQSRYCSPFRLNHGVLAVGYGAENGTDFWIVKNSWGSWWGDHGYIRLARNKQNMCGIASMASVPTLARFP
ncbi:Secreted cathepsin L 1 [Fasciolopsis buskii]|uniref:Secreted cathepsin L 1 n=1 Tax=Fasciolopsis buskii TaxID=27845 RepID=A0A8E0S8R3_9TREM|nr:Secreted cathepsin L 1 [Fasciolopsis buski]